MILCIAEKPSVARDIAKVIGATTSRDGYMEGNGYCVTWVFGHLCELKDPGDYTPMWRHWNMSTLPMIPPRFGIRIKKDKGVERQFGIIENLIKHCDKVINCGDAGQEGELIQRWVMQKAGCTVPVERLWISSLTDEAIREGFSHLRPQKELESLYMAALCRAIGDWILGINGTRLYTLKYAAGDRYNDRKILSIGRVQTPTLALVVARQKEIEEFKPKDSYELRTKYRDVPFTSTLKPFETEDAGTPLMERLKGNPFTVTDVAKKKGREAPPRLYDLTSLQVDANRRLNLSAEQTLQAIQGLYEKKVATYPRVDTTYLTDDVYPKCGGILNSLTQYSSLLEPLRGARLRKSKKVFDNSKVTDHHAIIPTGQTLPQGLTPHELSVFDLIARRFISVFHSDCEFEQTIVMGEVIPTPEEGKRGPAKVEFKATGRVIINPGWKMVYAKDKDSDEDGREKDEERQTLPPFVKGETGPHEPFLYKKTTKPPKPYTEGTLLKAMETAGASIEDEDLREALKANGIGRPSTRAGIIETLYRRKYIQKKGKSLIATPEGISLIDIINEELLKSAKLTGIWEGRLRAIERGDYSASEFIDSLKQMIHAITLSVLADTSGRKI